jgi:hypothetical protein
MRLPVPVRPVAYCPPADLSIGSRIAKNIAIIVLSFRFLMLQNIFSKDF